MHIGPVVWPYAEGLSTLQATQGAANLDVMTFEVR